MEGFNPDQNPFAEILAQLKQQGGQPQLPTAGGADAATAPQGGQQLPPNMTIGPDGQPQEVPDATQPGVNPGTTKFLLGALQQLQQFIGAASDRDEIAVARSVIMLLTKLISSDQEKQGQVTDQMHGQPQAGQTPAPQAGAQPPVSAQPQGGAAPQAGGGQGAGSALELALQAAKQGGAQ
jgi:hypothetical protein